MSMPLKGGVSLTKFAACRILTGLSVRCSTRTRASGSKPADFTHFQYFSIPAEFLTMTYGGVDQGRRRFLTATTTVVGAIGAAYTAVPFIASWTPSARAKARKCTHTQVPMQSMISMPTVGRFTISVTHHNIVPRYSQAVELNMQVRCMHS